MTPGEKLVRDLIPELDLKSGGASAFRTAQPHEMPGLLFRKLTEEVAEVMDAGPCDMAEEIADVLEVLYAIGEMIGHTEESLDHVRTQKALVRGRFRERIVMELE